MQTRPIDGRCSQELARALARGWEAVSRRGGLDYDPAGTLRARAGPFTFLSIPGRQRRPGAAAPLTGEGLLRRHARCPFDDPGVLDLREVLRFARDGRTYHVIANRFPVRRLHYLPVRSLAAPRERLPQTIHDAAELEDMLLLCRAIGPEYRFFFNSNAGADGSHSGSSVNHWHFQIFPDPGDILEPIEPPAGAAAELRAIPGWPFPHRLLVATDAAALAHALLEALRPSLELDIAYNIVMRTWEGGGLAAAVFPRAPCEAVRVTVAPGRDAELSGRFGGFELTGAVVAHDPAVVEWARDHPGAAERIARERLRRSTRDTWNDGAA